MDKTVMKERLQELQQELSRDPRLRETILADPKPVLEQKLGQAFPEGVNNEAIRKQWPEFFQIEETRAAGGELTDQQLETVAGGHPSDCGACACITDTCGCTCV
jgi:hypothetical protein